MPMSAWRKGPSALGMTALFPQSLLKCFNYVMCFDVIGYTYIFLVSRKLIMVPFLCCNHCFWLVILSTVCV
jgi:hypothetical protein